MNQFLPHNIDEDCTYESGMLGNVKAGFPSVSFTDFNPKILPSGMISFSYQNSLTVAYTRNFVVLESFTMFASSNKPNSPGETIHQTYPTAVKGHYGGIVSRPV